MRSKFWFGWTLFFCGWSAHAAITSAVNGHAWFVLINMTTAAVMALVAVFQGVKK